MKRLTEQTSPKVSSACVGNTLGKNSKKLASLMEIDGRTFSIGIARPFSSAQTTGHGDADAVYFHPHTNGFTNGRFHCLHADWADRSQDEFLYAICFKRECPPKKPNQRPYYLADAGNGQRSADQHRETARLCFPTGK